jgi:FkbH-like protein
MSAEHKVVLLAGSYTLDPLAEVIDGWADYLGLPVRAHVADYGQLFQQLLSPASRLRCHRNGANIVAVRWEDLLGRAASGAWSTTDLDARTDELASALASWRHDVPCLLLLGPCGTADARLAAASQALRARLAGVTNLYVESGEAAMTRYRVAQAHDAASDRFGHVPFTPEAFAALGTVAARWYASLVRAPLKAIAVDGDQTLWAGVVGEDGTDGVRVDAAQLALQRALIEQSAGGRLLCMLSKNEESEVRSLFDRRSDMPLQWRHFMGHRIDWNDKPDNLRQLAAELELGLAAFAFLDDNPLECAQMRARCPEVTTIRIPSEQLDTFVEHLWILDQPAPTAEDRHRVQMYRDTAARAALRKDAASLAAFIDGLQLEVEIDAVSPPDVPRLAQLTQRTNQFNASLARCDESEIRRELQQPSLLHRLVRARDRFGDYGVVGQLRAKAEGTRLVVDLFMLSCRALGRGIEHRMIAMLGAHAVAAGLQDVEIVFRDGPRNAPMRRFLQQAFGALEAGESRPRLSAPKAAALVFNAASLPQHDAFDEPVQQPVAAEAVWPSADAGALYERIATELTSAVDIVRALARRMRSRPDLPTGFVAASTAMERELAGIWQDVLRIDRIGAHDRFQDLGGKSIQLVQVHRLLCERLGVDVSITTMFEHATISALAAHLASGVGSAPAAPNDRGLRMREARRRAGARHGVYP